MDIRDDKECKIPNDTVFGHFMRYVFNQETFFVVNTIEPTKSDASVPSVVVSRSESDDFPPIYENPDRFFVHFLAKVKMHSINYARNVVHYTKTVSGLGQLLQKSNANHMQSERKHTDPKVSHFEATESRGSS